MARKPRIEFPGAIYHVFSRGNYRKALFTEPGSGKAFVRALFEAAEFSNWRLHAYTIMDNHYHAAIETPDGNLIAGMQWLQGTFANRFNRFHNEHGHVFQGRYKSPLVEPGDALRRVVDYIHLNPVRAGITSFKKLRNYELSSYRQFWKDLPPQYLCRGQFLGSLGLPDNLEGMRAYENWLGARENEDLRKKEALTPEFNRSWIIGSVEFREEIQDLFSDINIAGDWGGPEVQELSVGKWERIVQEELENRQLREDNLNFSPKLVAWKIEISRRLRKETTASNGWIACRLNMGHPSNVSRYRKRMPKSKG